MGSPRREGVERWAIVGLALLASVLVLGVARVAQPEEDAAMLMRYAENFAAGHGIVYNPSGPPVDGATDLLVVPLAAIPMWLGLSVDDAFTVVGGLSLIVSVCLLFAFSRRRGNSLAASMVLALFVLTGKALFYLQLGYMAPVFGLAVLGLWVATDDVRQRGFDSGRVARFVAAALIAGLVRPEGFAFAGLALLSILITGNPQERRSLLRPTLLTAGAGAAFVAARWAYFGAPLPNPLYVKAGGALHPDGLLYAIAWTMLLAGPALAVLVAALVPKATRRLALAQVVPLVLAVGMWLLLSNATNRGGRFQYAGSMLAYAGAAIVLPALLAAMEHRLEGRPDLRRPARAGVAVAVVACLGIQVIALAPTFGAREPTVYDALAEALTPYRGQDRTLMTTEAGNVPLRSRWHSVDAYGLNDAQIARSGGIDRARIAEERPDLIIVHGTGARRWADMVAELRAYAESEGYLVAVPFGELDRDFVDDTWQIYVRPGAEDADELVAAIQDQLRLR